MLFISINSFEAAATSNWFDVIYIKLNRSQLIGSTTSHNRTSQLCTVYARKRKQIISAVDRHTKPNTVQLHLKLISEAIVRCARTHKSISMMPIIGSLAFYRFYFGSSRYRLLRSSARVCHIFFAFWCKNGNDWKYNNRTKSISKCIKLLAVTSYFLISIVDCTFHTSKESPSNKCEWAKKLNYGDLCQFSCCLVRLISLKFWSADNQFRSLVACERFVKRQFLFHKFIFPTCKCNGVWSLSYYYSELSTIPIPPIVWNKIKNVAAHSGRQRVRRTHLKW